MTASYGVTPAGFVVKPQSAILSDMQASVLALIDPQFDLSPSTPDGQMLGIVANGYGSLWELLGACYNQYNREDTEGAGLDNIGDITGTLRESATYTQVSANLTLDPGTYAAGTLVANVAGNQTFTFANLGSITSTALSGTVSVVGGSASVTFSTPQTLSAGQSIFFLSEDGVIYVVAASVVSSLTATLTNPYNGVTAGATTTVPVINAIMQAQAIGETPSVNPGTLTQITTPVTGWTSINNPTAQSQLGTNSELDNPYMIRQLQDVTAEGSCTASSLAAALNELGAAQNPPQTLQVLVLENTSNVSAVIQGVTMPPHTFSPVVYDGGTGWATSIGQPLIAQVIYNNKPAGITSFGGIVNTIEDEFLGQQFVYFSVPTPEPVYISATVVPRGGVPFASLVLAIQTALVNAAVAATPASGLPPAGQLAPGSPIIGSQLEAVIMGVPGVLDVQALAFDLFPNPSNTAPIVVPATNIATIAESTSPTNVVITLGTYP